MYENGKIDDEVIVYFNIHEASKGVSNDRSVLLGRLLDTITAQVMRQGHGPAGRPLARRIYKDSGEEVLDVHKLETDGCIWLSFGEKFISPYSEYHILYTLEPGGGGVFIYYCSCTDLIYNAFQKKLLMQNTNIWICPRPSPPPPEWSILLCHWLEHLLTEDETSPKNISEQRTILTLPFSCVFARNFQALARICNLLEKVTPLFTNFLHGKFAYNYNVWNLCYIETFFIVKIQDYNI